MCSALVRLIKSIMAARVVVFPEPVGPVTRISPLGLFDISRTTSGKPKVSKLGILELKARKQAA